MAIRVALRHVTHYRYDRDVSLGPQVVRLRPAPHCRTPVLSYSLEVTPKQHFINWQQDPHGNFLARFVFPEQTSEFKVAVDLTADLSVINPFDFFIEDSAEQFPFEYAPETATELKPYLETQRASLAPLAPVLRGEGLGVRGIALGPVAEVPLTPDPSPRSTGARGDMGRAFEKYLASVDRTPRKTVTFLVELNQKLWSDISYLIRLEPGVQTPEETLTKRSGSCRDSAWLLVQLLRHVGIAARFVSGYLVQLTADEKSLDGPSGPEKDFTDLHAWCEAFIPGAGWVGLDPTSGLLTGEGHIPLAATPAPQTAAPISGAVDQCKCKFSFEMSVERVHEDPRVTKPYSDEQWEQIDRLGQHVDERLKRGDVRLTMGGEPTFVSIDDQAGAEWNVGAVGPMKQRLSCVLVKRLRERFAPGALLHFGQGKWYPGESLPRWAYSCFWRVDGEPIWKNSYLLADLSDGSRLGARAVSQDYEKQAAAKSDLHPIHTAEEFLTSLAEQLEVGPQWIRPAYEDVWHTVEAEQKLPVDVDPRQFDLDADEDRRRLARTIEEGLSKPAGFVLPLTRAWWQSRAWLSGPWPFRSERLFLIPGDSPIGLRLPMDRLPASWSDARTLYVIDPFDGRPALPGYEQLRNATRRERRDSNVGVADVVTMQSHETASGKAPVGDPRSVKRSDVERRASISEAPEEAPTASGSLLSSTGSNAIATALCIEPRQGRLHVFMPPLSRLEDYLELLSEVEATAERLQQPVVIEGYLPPHDPRLQVIKVTPDPGVIEVNVHPARDWDELKTITTGVYEEARLTRLGTEKFQLDGKHTGTGGGNHIVLGGATPADSPFLRRPDVLRSLITYWNNHPSLSYLFAGQFIGPTSQAPRVDEGRRDALYELELACQQIGLPPIQSDSGTGSNYSPRPGTPGRGVGGEGRCDAANGSAFANDDAAAMAPHPCPSPRSTGARGEYQTQSSTVPPWLVDRVFRNLLVDITGNTHRAEICIDKLFSPDSSTGRLGLVELRAFEMPPHSRMSLTQQLLVRALVCWFWEQPLQQRLTHWGTTLHDRCLLPHFLKSDLNEVLTDLRGAGFDFRNEWFTPHFEFRCPVIGSVVYDGMKLELRTAIEPWYVLGEEPGGGGTARYVDSSVERLQVHVTGFNPERFAVTCNGRITPLQTTGVPGEYIAGVRYRAWQPPSCLHPTIPVHTPLVFDIVDRWRGRSIGGCRYHVDHAGGLNPSVYPINALEAECRRSARFFAMGHTGGAVDLREESPLRDYPCTLDLRVAR